MRRTFVPVMSTTSDTLSVVPFRLPAWLRERGAYHTLFWIGVYVVLCLLDWRLLRTDPLFALTNELIVVVLYAALVYFNLLYLIPKFLAKKQFTAYLGLLFLSILIFTPLRVLTLYFKFSTMPHMQTDLVRNLNLFFVPTAFVAISSTVYKIVVDWVTNLREKQELQTKTMQTELRFLRSQINPHFLFNTLNSLYALTLKKSDDAPEIVLKLSEMMRYMLYECNEKRVLLKKEVNYLGNYLDLERIRHGKQAEISFDVQGTVDGQTIAPLMFIPFVENSFKHGVNHSVRESFVRIFMDVEDKAVQFYIENSKPEVAPLANPHRPSGGIGLVNVRRRLELLYPGRYELDAEESPDTYAVNLRIELC